jgi:hypothetical protein
MNLVKNNEDGLITYLEVPPMLWIGEAPLRSAIKYKWGLMMLGRASGAAEGETGIYKLKTYTSPHTDE